MSSTKKYFKKDGLVWSSSDIKSGDLGLEEELHSLRNKRSTSIRERNITEYYQVDLDIKESSRKAFSISDETELHHKYGSYDI